VGLSQSTIRYLRVPAPPAGEAVAIADYLDRETTQIDAFIAKNEELIALLVERGQALISAAFGKELKRVPLWALSREPIRSGVDAIGDAANPEDWVRYVRTTDISAPNRLDPEKRVSIARSQVGHASVARNDLLLTRAGSIGTSYLHADETEAAFAGYLVRVRPDERRVLPEYLALWTQSQGFLDQVRSGVVVSTIENFSAAKYRSTRVPLAELEDQKRISARLQATSRRVEEAVMAAQRAVALARERRAALISAAVTGKLDVGVTA